MLVAVLSLPLFGPIASGQAAAVNGIENGDLSAGGPGAFTCFTDYGWGSHASSVSAVTGRGGFGRAASLTISGWASGDRKLQQTESAGCAPAVVAGQQYQLGVWYTSTREVNVTLSRHSADGWTYYTDLQTLPAATSFTQVQVVTPPLPAGTDQLSFGLSIVGNGTVVTDDYSIAEVAGQATPVNGVPNGDLSAGGPSAFTCFSDYGWGSHTSSVSAVTGRGGSGRAASMTVTGWVSGDRKLLQTQSAGCAPAVVGGQQYQLGVWYTSTREVNLTLFRHSAAGWTYYTDLQTLPAADTFTQAQVETPPLPAGTDQLSFGLSIVGNGTVVTDDYAIAAVGTTPDPGTQLATNGDLSAGAGVPTCFQMVGWGQNSIDQQLIDDVPAGATGRSWRISMSNRQSGDYKLIAGEAAGCAPTVTPGQVYDFSVKYRSTAVGQSITLFRHTPAGWQYWMDPQSLPVSPDWSSVTVATPAIPADTDRVSFGVSIYANGDLDTTGYSFQLHGDQPTDDPTDPAVVGKWTVSDTQLPLRTIHSTMLKDGRLLLIAGSGNQADQFRAGTFKAAVWDPGANTFTNLTVPEDMFCSGHVTLADGRVLIAGGTANFPGTGGAINFQGAKFSYVFDPATMKFTKISDMADAHWYPTLTKLGNGDVWAAGGLNAQSNGPTNTEMFSYGQFRWLGLNEVPQTWTYWGTYPHMFLMADGRMFYSGGHTFGNQRPGTGASIYDWRTAQVADVPGLREPNLRDQAGSVLLPPAQNQKVMIVGGGNTEQYADGTDLVDVINLNAASPTYTPAPTVPGGGRTYINLVTLPDRTVLATGGAHGNRGAEVASSSTYDPVGNRWIDTADDPIGRGYHSSAILLPDGRVAVLGSNPMDNSFELRISVYSPPYLFKGARPTVTVPATTAGYGQQLNLAVTGDVVAASLTAPSSATHQTDTNARLVDLPITGSGATRQATVPANRNLLPPGPYMLTVLDSTGVPSVARWVMVG